MPMTLKVGFDGETYGSLVIRDGKVDIVADSDANRQELGDRFDAWAIQAVEIGGFDAEQITAEDVLRFAASRGQGRNWTELTEGDG